MSSSASLASAPAHTGGGDAPRVLVWDLPTRLFHWMLAASFFGAYVVSESERWIVLHAMLGYTAIGLIVFRLLWGIVGTRYARFTGFAWSPRAVAEYLKSLVSRRPQHYVGHNPAASWAIVALLALVAVTALSGWAVLNEVGGEWLEDVHEAAANATLALVAFHVAAVFVSSVLHRENLVLAMVSGFKRARDAVPAAGTRWLVGAGLLAAVAAFWFGLIPAPGLDRGAGPAAVFTPAAKTQSAERPGRRHHDDD